MATPQSPTERGLARTGVRHAGHVHDFLPDGRQSILARDPARRVEGIVAHQVVEGAVPETAVAVNVVGAGPRLEVAVEVTRETSWYQN